MSIRKENPKIDFVSNEHEILEFWEKNQIFQNRSKTCKFDQYGLEMDSGVYNTNFRPVGCPQGPK